ncbi:metallophosphoesterase [Halosegnis marinus]|uniref:Metallophosphoesterase n=1 Tax=Halosegnis marinus TaxID=3034023 RepID=A0ABD5ZRI2_9EURY|nr:metallophosphoesterase [Halosegnis sp. DT85]
MRVEYRDRAAFLPDHDTLVVADVHLGRDETSAVELRLGEHEDITGRVAALCDRFAPEAVVVAGDLLHSFSTLPRGVMESLSALETTARDAGARAVVVRGNHDTMLDEVWDGPTATEYRVGDWVVCHGHEPPETEAAGYLVGHDHPAIEIEGQRRPCYLRGDGVYRDADLLMLPAFTPLAPGVVVNRMRARDFQSPLVTDADALRPVVRDADGDETLTFPPLGKLRRLL